jgi:hypothetical protein
MSLENIINKRNIDNLQAQINMKKGSEPYFSTIQTNTNVLTDYDTFPYIRYFRGVAESSIPIVAEREAGWRPRNEDCYNAYYIRAEKQKKHHDIVTPRNYFQPACSTMYPKYINPDDPLFGEIRLNENCVISYR